MKTRTFQHKKSGDLYSLLGLIKHKHPETREWLNHVLYACQAGNLYSRTVEDFLEHFEEVR